MHYNLTVLCTDTVEDTSLVCSPTNGQFTVFLKLDAPAEAATESKNILLMHIQDGMNVGRYTSDVVEQVIFASDLDQPSSENTDTYQPSKQVDNGQAQVFAQGSSFPVFAIVASVISFVVVVIGIILMKRRKRRNIASYKARRKSVVSFAPSLEEEIPASSYHSTSVASSRDEDINSVGETIKPNISDSSSGSDMILQWDFKKDKFASNF